MEDSSTDKDKKTLEETLTVLNESSDTALDDSIDEDVLLASPDSEPKVIGKTETTKKPDARDDAATTVNSCNRGIGQGVKRPANSSNSCKKKVRIGDGTNGNAYSLSRKTPRSKRLDNQIEGNSRDVLSSAIQMHDLKTLAICERKFHKVNDCVAEKRAEFKKIEQKLAQVRNDIREPVDLPDPDLVAEIAEIKAIFQNLEEELAEVRSIIYKLYTPRIRLNIR